MNAFAKVCILIQAVYVIQVVCDKCNTALPVTEYDTYFRNHGYENRKVGNLRECLNACYDESRCLSFNYCLMTKTCELNDVGKDCFPEDVTRQPSSIHGIKPTTKKTSRKTCAEVKQAFSNAVSGYYQLEVRCRLQWVYCDMESFDGGWALVVSISSTSREHLIREQKHCLNWSLCVPLPESVFPVRKLPDEDIHALANHNGTFRVDIRSGGPNYTVFYGIPSGASNFDSSCIGLSCPRIIISHSYPYTWESNCKGTELGYKIFNGPHRVFDSHDNRECDNKIWTSSDHGSRRALYGHSSLGIYNGRQGLLFVK